MTSGSVVSKVTALNTAQHFNFISGVTDVVVLFLWIEILLGFSIYFSLISFAVCLIHIKAWAHFGILTKVFVTILMDF